MRSLTILSAVLAAAVSAFLYSRASTLYIFYANAPSRLPHVNNVKEVQVQFEDRLRNCEDLAIDTFERFAILSCDPGRGAWNTVMGPLSNPLSPQGTGLYLWYYDNPNSVPEQLKLEKFDHKAETFHPLGIDYVANGRKLYVVNHGANSVGIEIFKLSSADRKLSHVRTLSHDLLSAPNAVVAFSGSQFFATNDHYFKFADSPMLSKLESYLGLPGGTIVHGDRPAKFKPGQDLQLSVMDRLSFANGLTFLNATTLAAASTSRLQVRLYDVGPGSDGHSHPSLNLIKTITLPFLVDNLKSDKRGTLFLAGHPHPPSTEHMAKNAAKCSSVSKEGCNDNAKGLSWISEWSEADGLKHLYVGDEFPTSSTAVMDTGKGIGMAVGLYAKGVLTWVDSEAVEQE